MIPIAEAPRCRLYLTTPPELVSGGIRLRDFLSGFVRAIGAVDIACLLIEAPEDATDDVVEAVARPIAAHAQAQGIATLIANRAALAQRAGDGVHLGLRTADQATALRTYREARKTLGAAAIIGALCADERHMAMEIAELDADYVGFSAEHPGVVELIGWWAEMMNAPCVAFDVADPDQARMLAHRGADFIAPSPEIWNDPDFAPWHKAIGSGER